MTYWPPTHDAELRSRGLGFANSVRLQALPAVPQQSIAIGARPFIQNLWGPIAFQYPLQGIAEIRAGTVGTNTIARFYEDLEGFLAVRGDVGLTKITAGPVTFTLSIVVGVDLDTVGGSPDFGVLFRTDFTLPTSNSNNTGTAHFETDFLFSPFPGVDGSGRRFFDVGFQIFSGSAETIQLTDSYGRVRREWYG